MNFKANKDKQHETEIKIAVERSTKAAKDTLGRIVLSFSIALLIFTIVNISNESDKNTLTEISTVTTAETAYEETGVTTTNVTTTTKVTTTTAAVTTTPVTTTVTVATTEVETEAVDVPATERSVVIEVEENKTYMEPPVHEELQVVEIVETEPEPAAPEVNNEPVPEPEPTVQEQSYYSDDGDYGWSHVAVRYSAPSLDADKERYHAANEFVSEEERILLVNIVASEYGSDWISVSEKAKVVAVVMNRVNDNYNGKTTIYDVLTDYGQFQGYSPQYYFYRSTTPTCIDAVDYYFLHKDEWQYQNIKYISGHGSYNTFS